TWKARLTWAPPGGFAHGALAVVRCSRLRLSFGRMPSLIRPRLYGLAWLFPLVMVATSIFFGTDQAFWPVPRGVLYAVLSVGWLTWRFESGRLAGAESTIISDTVRPGSWKNPVLRRRVIGGAVIMAIAAGGAFAASPLLDPPEGTIRYAQRDRIT